MRLGSDIQCNADELRSMGLHSERAIPNDLKFFGIVYCSAVWECGTESGGHRGDRECNLQGLRG